MSKRLFDIVVSVLALVVLSPLMLIVALLVIVFLGRPVFFTQARSGLNGQEFTLYKFRSMKSDVSPDGQKLPDDKRLTGFGKFLRAHSLDELPGLINVIRGDMSLVGPRPLMAEYLPLFNSSQMRRHEVRPGITGWAQINGRNAISWQQKFDNDLWYVDNHNMWLDIKIILVTIKKVLTREGICPEGSVSVEKFTGSEK